MLCCPREVCLRNERGVLNQADESARQTRLKQDPKVAISLWKVAELGAFYTEHLSELLAHTNRVLKDSAKAEEFTQA